MYDIVKRVEELLAEKEIPKTELRKEIRSVRVLKVSEDGKYVSMRVPSSWEKELEEIAKKAGFAKRYVRTFVFYVGLKIVRELVDKLVEENGEEITGETPKEEE